MLHLMRIILNIKDDLMRRVKRHAVETGSTITEVVEEALRTAVAGQAPSRKPYILNWNPAAGRTLPGIDLADRDSICEAMEVSG
jgi:hypothetical protein